MELYYLAHPVRPTKSFTTEQNLDHALKVQKHLFDAGILTVAPWYSWVDLFRDTQNSNSEVMSQMLQMDLEVARMLKRIVLTGHELSSGMDAELKLVLSLGGKVINLIGIPDDQIEDFVLGVDR